MNFRKKKSNTTLPIFFKKNVFWRFLKNNYHFVFYKYFIKYPFYPLLLPLYILTINEHKTMQPKAL